MTSPESIAPDVPWTSGLTRAALLVSALFYAATLHHAHAGYLQENWQEFGFHYNAVELGAAMLAALLVIAGAAFLPASLRRPSSVLLLLLFVVVYVPTIVITVGVEADAFSRYGDGLVALAVGFTLACIAARLQRAPSIERDRIPGRAFGAILLALWLVACAVLLIKYASIMRFVGEESLYEQRAAGASTSLFLGYTQTYFSNVLSPALMAWGLVRRRWTLVALGAAGCLIMYMISAQRTVFMLPFVIVGLFVVLSSRHRLLRSSAFLVASLGALVTTVVGLHSMSSTAAFLSQFLVFRTLAVPGLTFSQYYDVFATGGFTWWSHVRGVSLLVAAPPWYANDPVWPSLGYMIGEWFHASSTFNINANLFSGDGVAAAGAFGVVVMGALLAVWLVLLDRASRGWDNRFALLVTLPVALTLTNGPLFTTLLSFGGLFWTLLFFLHKPGSHNRQRIPAQSDAIRAPGQTSVSPPHPDPRE